MDKITKVLIDEHIIMAKSRVGKSRSIYAPCVVNLLDNLTNVIRDGTERPIPKDIRLILFKLDALKACYICSNEKWNWSETITKIKTILKIE